MDGCNRVTATDNHRAILVCWGAMYCSIYTEADMKPFELCSLMNLAPSTAEEAKALVPSLEVVWLFPCIPDCHAARNVCTWSANALQGKAPWAESQQLYEVSSCRILQDQTNSRSTAKLMAPGLIKICLRTVWPEVLCLQNIGHRFPDDNQLQVVLDQAATYKDKWLLEQPTYDSSADSKICLK